MIALSVHVTNLRADTVAPHYPFIAVSFSGKYYFQMLPLAHVVKSSQEYDDQDGKGAAYRLNEDGTSNLLWKTEGWYSFSVFLSEDARHLVRLERLVELGDAPEKSVGIAFYEDGNLLRQYSIADLVKDQGKFLRSTSFYRWILKDVLPPGSPKGSIDPDAQLLAPTLQLNNVFVLSTCDGIEYHFDVVTGNILNQRKR